MNKGSILVVDDTPESLSMVTETLAAEGYDVRPADSGKLALNSVAKSRPDLILLDIRMPLMDGFEVCRRLKSTRQNRNIPVIFLSALHETEERVEGLKLGAVDFISKPFRKEELLARIETHLELSGLRRRLEQRIAERTAELRAANELLKVELAERIRAEQALRESEIRFRSMADHAPVIIWTSGPDTRIDFCNQYGLALTGRKLEELAGEGWKQVVHPEDLELKYPAYAGVIASHREYRAEYRLRRADGEYRWMLDTATPRFLNGGAFAGYIGVAVDITDLRRNQEQLAAAQRLESLGVLVAGVAHNFNNMFAALMVEADLALSDLPHESPARGSIERINGIVARASDVVALLMAYAQPGAGGVFPAAVHIGYVVEEITRLFRATLPKKVALTVALAPNVPAIRADIAQIRQVVMNLLSNAWESLPDKQGAIAITTSSMRIGPEGAAGNGVSALPGDYVRLEVADSGCGMAEEVLPRIFEPFYSTKFLGRGLGLAAVQGIVRSLGGVIDVRSAVGKGSTFEVLIPAINVNGPAET